MYTEPCQTSNMDCFAKIGFGFLPLTIFAKCSILDIRQGSEHISQKSWVNVCKSEESLLSFRKFADQIIPEN